MSPQGPRHFSRLCKSEYPESLSQAFHYPEDHLIVKNSAQLSRTLTTNLASTALKACLSAMSPTTWFLEMRVRELQTATASLRRGGQRMAICCSGANLPCSTGSIPCNSGCSHNQDLLSVCVCVCWRGGGGSSRKAWQRVSAPHADTQVHFFTG